MRLAAAIWVVCGCGRVGFAVHADALEPDAALGAFGPAQLLAPLDAPGEDDDPTVTGDGLELYFQSQRLGTRDIFVARRATTDAPWDAPVLVTELSTPSQDDSPEITPDGLVMFLGSDRPGGQGDYDIWMTSRASRTDPWLAPQPVAALSSPTHDLSCVFDSTRLEVILHSQRTGGAGDRDLYRATRADLAAPFSAPVLIEQLSSPAYDGNPVLTNADRVLWFDSERAGLRDIYMTIRASRDVPFDVPVLVTELSTPADDSDPWVSEDGRWIVFASNRTGDFELYEARR